MLFVVLGAQNGHSCWNERFLIQWAGSALVQFDVSL